MSRRSGGSLTFKDAVRLLDDGSPFVHDLDALIGVTFDAIPAGNLLALPYFAFRRKLVEYGEKIVSGIHDHVDGVGRYDRTQRLYAAHMVIVMAAFGEALGEIPDSTNRQVERSSGTTSILEAHEKLVRTLGETDTLDPSPGRIHQIDRLYTDLTEDVGHLLATWGLENTQEMLDTLLEHARRRYEENFRRLAAQAPEFAVWAYLAEHAATRDKASEVGQEIQALGDELRARLDSITTGLAAVPELLAEVSGRAAANRVRTNLADTYQAALRRSVLGETHAPDGVVLPTLERGYVNPAVRFTLIGVTSEKLLEELGGPPMECPSEDRLWDQQRRYDDVQSLLIGELISPDALTRPIVILGQPGAGKSVLTRILSARLADRGFLPVRVELRNVPADADVQTQVERAIRTMTGWSVQWPDLADQAHEDGLLPLVILDGFDELLQATGVNRSDYLEQVAQFQQRELDLNRPVAAIVTSRTAVADRARFPKATRTLRIEPFDEARVTTWLDAWNEANGWSLDTETMLRYSELAEQPLLLTLLALYDAGSGAFASAEAGLGRAELYDRLLSEFALREVRKGGTGLDSEQERRAVAAELHRLSIVALAMFNRHAQVITGTGLDRDLAALLTRDDEPARTGTGMAKPLTAAQLTVGRFFFVHESQAVRDDEHEHAYEFLHATFGEFLVARLVVETLRALVRLRAFQESEGVSASLDDGDLWRQLSFAALAGTAARVEFLEGLLARLPEEERAALRAVAEELLHAAPYANPHHAYTGYEPESVAVYERHAYYSANLTLLAVLSSDEPLHFHPRESQVWKQAFSDDDFNGMRDSVRMLLVEGEDRSMYYERVVREDGSDVDPYDFGLVPGVYGEERRRPEIFADIMLQAHGESGTMVREFAFSPYRLMSLGDFLPYLQFVGDVSKYGGTDRGSFIPASRALLELRLAPFSAHGAAKREQIYRWCFDNLRGCSPALSATILRQLREDIRDFPARTVADLLCEVPNWQGAETWDAFCDALSVLRDADHKAAQAVVHHVDEAGNVGAGVFSEDLLRRIDEIIA